MLSLSLGSCALALALDLTLALGSRAYARSAEPIQNASRTVSCIARTNITLLLFVLRMYC